jgi:uncharacterized membrane protein YhaH (DUF805 family)
LSWREFLLSWNGRLNRRQAALGLYGLGFVAMIAIFILLPIVGFPSGGGYIVSQGGMFAIYLTQVVVAPFQASMLVRRVHDHGKSGWIWLAVLAAFLVGLAFAELPGIRDTAFGIIVAMPIVLGFFWLISAPGDARPNKYGPPPRPTWWP